MFQMSAGGKGVLRGAFPRIMKQAVGPEAQEVGEAPKDTEEA